LATFTVGVTVLIVLAPTAAAFCGIFARNVVFMVGLMISLRGANADPNLSIDGLEL
jgi:hypothetical protein